MEEVIPGDVHGRDAAASSTSGVLTRRVLFREFLIALVPVAALGIALGWGNLLVLDYVHVLSGGTWTGVDLFMGVVMSRVFRALPIPGRVELAKRLTPRELFLLPSLASVAITSGIYVALTEGRFNLSNPLILAAGIVVLILTVQGFGFLLPTSVRILLEINKPKPDTQKIARLQSRNLLAAGSQAVFQFAIIFIMANLAL